MIRNKFSSIRIASAPTKRLPRYRHWEGGCWKNYQKAKRCHVCGDVIEPGANCFDTGGHNGLYGTYKYCQHCGYEVPPRTYGGKAADKKEALRRMAAAGRAGAKAGELLSKAGVSAGQMAEAFKQASGAYHRMDNVTGLYS